VLPYAGNGQPETEIKMSKYHQNYELFGNKSKKRCAAGYGAHGAFLA
jgi:hypothetical protein